VDPDRREQLRSWLHALALVALALGDLATARALSHEGLSLHTHAPLATGAILRDAPDRP
jgi:hypothetical protein